MSEVEHVDVDINFENKREEECCVMTNKPGQNETRQIAQEGDVVNVVRSKVAQDPCGCYSASIYSSYRVAELDDRPSTSYMEQVQRDTNPNMRAKLIDFLVNALGANDVDSDRTLYLTVNLIDRFLSHNRIDEKRLLLLGVTCMLIAWKYEFDEVACVPQVDYLCYLGRNTFTKLEVLSLEIQVLNFLRFRLSVPTTKTFLILFIQVADDDKALGIEFELLANYLAELTLLEYSFLRFLPSVIAASAVFLARWTLDQTNHPWSKTLEYYTRYEMSDLKSTVLAMEELQLSISGSKRMTIRNKYNNEKFMRVSTLKSPERVTRIFS